MQVTDACQDCKRNDLVMSSKGMTGLSGGVNINNNPTLQVRRHSTHEHSGAAAVPAVLQKRCMQEQCWPKCCPPAATQIAWAFESCAPLISGGIKVSC